MGKTWLITSGKGGVGKSTAAACLGLALAELGRTVCIVDGDTGLRDQDAILGLADRIVYDLMDVTTRRCRLEQALIPSEINVRLVLLPAAQFARCKELKDTAFTTVLKDLRKTYDHVLIDCPAGIERGFRALLHGPIDETILITTPDDVCMRDAERTAMVLAGKKMPRPQLIVNRLDEDLVRNHEMYTAKTAADTLDLQLLGEIPEDRAVCRAALSHRTALQVECQAGDAFRRIARRMNGEEVQLPAIGTGTLPWFRKLFRRAPAQLIPKEVKPD